MISVISPLLGETVTLDSSVYHQACFSCFYCGNELSLDSYRIRCGMIYCKTHDLELLAPQCGFCRELVSEKALVALNKVWHVDHFLCTQCSTPLGVNEDTQIVNYFIHDGKAYCREDYEKLFASPCKGCEKPILESLIVCKNASWHESCFRCVDCGRTFEHQVYYEIDGMPYCEEHFHKKRGTLCHECKGSIMGSAVQAMGHRFHPHHFNCKYCQVRG